MIEALIHHTHLPLAFSFEDDGRVAYGYLHDAHGKVVADVWLYNRAETPHMPEWTSRDSLPFRNAAEYSKSTPLYALPSSEHEISAGWTSRPDGAAGVVVLLRASRLPSCTLEISRDGP